MVDRDGHEPEQRVLIAGLFRFFDVSKTDFAARTTLRYGISYELITILENPRVGVALKPRCFVR